jgi:hypothetical protein
MKTGMGSLLGLAAFLATSFIVQLPDGASAQAVAAEGASPDRKLKDGCATHDIVVLIRPHVHLWGAEKIKFGKITDGSDPIKGANPGDIYFRPCPTDPVKIKFQLQGTSYIRWKTSKDSGGKLRGDDSIWMIGYQHGQTPQHPPGAADWPICKPKVINADSDRGNISFDFTGCLSPTYDFEYSLHLERCDDLNSAHPACVDVCVDPQIIFRPSTENH